MRVLMGPKNMGKGGNPYIDALSGGLEAAGLTVDQFTRRRLLGRYDIVHIHWPSTLINWSSAPKAIMDIAKVSALLTLAHRRGSHIVWTAHDLGPHETPHPRLWHAFRRVFMRQVDTVISLSPGGVELLEAVDPGIRKKSVHVVPHGHYRGLYPMPTETAASTRRRFGVPESGTLFLVFGQLRPYKGIDDIIRTFANMSSDATLLIAGASIDADHTAVLQKLVATTPNVVLHVDRISEQDTSALMHACDVVLAPYTEGSSLNSGAALLALSFDRPVVVRNTAVMRDLQQQCGAQWVHLASSGEDTVAIMNARSVASQLKNSSPDLEALRWDRVVQQTIAAYAAQTTRHVAMRSA